MSLIVSKLMISLYSSFRYYQLTDKLDELRKNHNKVSFVFRQKKTPNLSDNENDSLD